ncbi:MAG: EamA family transporter RarD [Rhodobacteraceae bacterium]|nr:EamA family transporter RarD [Paracoccaceae bacterium]
MGEAAKGVISMCLACAIWGLSALFYKQVDHIPAAEVMAHRIVWSLVFFAAVLAAQSRLRAIAGVLGDPRYRVRIALSAALISVNWFLFIFSIQIGRTVEASLGYYIFPLLAVLVGRFVYSEPLDRAQWLGVALAAAAVAVLTLGQGVAPWISLILASTFALYGVLKKTLDMGPVLSVSCEIAVVFPLALALLVWLHVTGQGGFGETPGTSAILVFSGPLTALPLILFSYAARRIAMGSVGVLQYINPTLQFLVAVLVFTEPFGTWHLLAFALIWSAVALYCVSALRRDRSADRSRAASAGVTATHR